MAELMAELGRRLVGLFSSFGLTCVILLCLFVLTLAGTLAQPHIGLYRAQKIYFDSFYWIAFQLGPIKVPFPGAQLLMILLFFNLLVGGIVRLKKTWSRAGILIVHLGIMMLLLAGFVEFTFAHEGVMAIREGEEANEYRSYRDWELAITEPLKSDEVRELVIGPARLAGLHWRDRVTFESPELPFDLVVSGYLGNSIVQPAASARSPLAARVVDGFYLLGLPPEKEAEQNLAGSYVELVEHETKKRHPAILWGGSVRPLVVEIAGRKWGLELRKKIRRLPFTIRLDKFTRKLHAGTDDPKSFSSDVTKREAGTERRVHIWMNHPLRHGGYVLYQEGFGPQGRPLRPGERWFSQLAVARNPADQWPKYACWVIALGLLLHFGSKLARHIWAESRQRA